MTLSLRSARCRLHGERFQQFAKACNIAAAETKVLHGLDLRPEHGGFPALCQPRQRHQFPAGHPTLDLARRCDWIIAVV
jgi:hypothetical protein